MRVFTLISWYDERPDWLAAAVASAAPFTNHFVAVDGAYALYPDGSGQSPSGQADAIREAARACGCGVSVHEPQHPWVGNEVEKRAAMFHLAEPLAAEEDWYFILDGDELVSNGDASVRAALEATELDVAEVMHWKHRDHAYPAERPYHSSLVEQHHFRKFFRAIRGLTVKQTHFTYVAPDGTQLWGRYPPFADALDLTSLRVEHRKQGRDLWRQKHANTYYERRDQSNIEGLKA